MPLDHQSIAKEELAKSTPQWHVYHSHLAASKIRPEGKVGLIIGCNRGEECKAFIDYGASYIVGIDPLDEVGVNYRGAQVKYHRCLPEEIPLKDGSVDFIYSYATFEHVVGLTAAYAEACRVLRPGGVICTVSAPLWNSRMGPHWGAEFYDLPWAHLRMTPSQIVEFCRGSANPAFNTISEDQIRYWLDPRFFNRRFARDYTISASFPENWTTVENLIYTSADVVDDDPLVQELCAKGYSRFELAGDVHMLHAVKHSA